VGEYEPRNGNIIMGGAAHTAVEVAYRYRMEGQDAPAKVVSEWLNAKVDHELAEAKRYDEQVVWGRDDRMNETFARMRAREASAAYIKEVVPHYEPESVEHVFSIQVSGCPVPVVGVTDLIAQPLYLPRPAQHCMVDVKFGRTAPHKPTSEWMVQGLLYLLAYDMPMTWHAAGWPLKDGGVNLTHPQTDSDLVLERNAQNYDIARRLVTQAVADIIDMARRRPEGPWQSALTHTYACSGCYWRERGCAWWPQPTGTLDPLAAL
jgi:hypothetical protein